MAARSNSLTALFQVAAGIAALCVMDALVKYLALRHGAPLTTLGRYASGTVIALMVWHWQGRPGLAPGGLKAHLLRGALIALMALSFFWAITQLSLSLALTLAFVGPLLVPPLAALFLKEPMQPRFVVAGLIGFVGVLVAAGGVPDLAGTRLLAVLAAVGAALLYGQGDVALGWTDLALMAALGLIGNIGVQLLARGYVHLEAQVSAVMEFSGLPWAALLGWLCFDEAVSPATLLGAAIIAGACIWAARAPQRAGPAF